MALQVSSRLGHYEVTALIGEGGMSQVYQATDTKLNSPNRYLAAASAAFSSSRAPRRMVAML